LHAVKAGKRKDYLAVAHALLHMNPSEATRRSVNFLISLCSTVSPADGPRLLWLEEEVNAPRIQLGLPSVLGRVAPAMQLRANLGR
jgi:hypothetical protein